jgi:hypothetical protein
MAETSIELSRFLCGFWGLLGQVRVDDFLASGCSMFGATLSLPTSKMAFWDSKFGQKRVSCDHILSGVHKFRRVRLHS